MNTLDVKHFKLIGGAIIAALVLTTLFSSFTQVDEGFRGVYLVMGKASEDALLPGLHAKVPFISEIREVPIRQKKFAQQTSASSKDLQTVNTTIAVNYRPEPTAAPSIYSTIGGENEIWEVVLLSPAIQEVTKSVTADSTAAQLVTNREAVKAEITELLVERLAKESIVVTEVSVTDFSFSASFMEAIEAKQVAEQEAMRAENELTKHTTDVKKKVETAKAEAAATITRAEGEKGAAILRAEGHALALQIEAKAEAEYHRKIDETISDRTLRLRELQKWDGDTPDVVSGDNLGIMLNRSP